MADLKVKPPILLSLQPGRASRVAVPTTDLESLVDNGNGTATYTGLYLVDNSDGTATSTGARIFDNHDGTATFVA